eukprot:TRINITY_DN57191_c0_g1_i1.p1 TRINITY_DN57191_c0_g1~~TRINITY_DN57191_c0_g1_i1.p1  ORF type:complete len:413 (-),score=87.88 TRINITY_DN57191_c0_g1_i1:541-1779(-)
MAPLAEQLHSLILAHLRHGGVCSGLLESLQEALSGLADPQGSDLFRVFAYAKEGELRLNIRALTGASLCNLAAHPMLRVRDVKERLQEKLSVLPNRQRLVLGDTVLKDMRMLAEYNIGPCNSDLMLVQLTHESLYVMGGQDADQNMVADVEIFDPALGYWEPLESLPTPRVRHAAAVLDGKVCIVGGRDSSGALASAEILDPALGGWRSLPEMGARRDRLAAVVLEGCLYAIGGRAAVALNCVERFDPTIGFWQQLPDMPTKRYGAAAAAIFDKIYVVGGHSKEDLSTVEIFDPGELKWVASRDMLSPRTNHAVAALDYALYVIGGSRGVEELKDVEVFDTRAKIWSNRPAMSKCRSELAAASAGGKIYVLGGKDESGRTLECGEIWDSVEGAWFDLRPMTLGRAAFAAVAV